MKQLKNLTFKEIVHPKTSGMISGDSHNELDEALRILTAFKGDGLKAKISELENYYVGKGKLDIVPSIGEYHAASRIKKLSTQIHEIIHAVGIINCLPNILVPGEEIVSLSLASSAAGEGIDLVTNKRMAEFKFTDKYKGMQKRHIFCDFVTLTVHKEENAGRILKRELYLFNALAVIADFRKSKADAFKRLNKSGKTVNNKLRTYLSDRHINDHTIRTIYELSKVEIIDLETVLSG